MAISQESLKNLQFSSGRLDRVGILLVGHGTRLPSGQDEFRRLYGLFAASVGPIACEMAFLEHAQPDIPQSIARLAARGVDRLLIVPALLFTAGHARLDIPRLVQQSAAACGMHVTGQTEPIDCSNVAVQVSAARYEAALNASGATGACEPTKSTVCWVLVGRGSSDPNVAVRMREFLVLRQSWTPMRQALLAFFFGQPPSLDEALEMACQSDAECIVVQPHLLFSGSLMDELRRRVADRQGQDNRRRWICTDVLGADPKLAELLAGFARRKLEKLVQSNPT